VTAADFVGLWHARTALEQFERLLGIERSSVNIVLNRHDARFHHSHQEVAWHLGAPVVASIPFDQVAMQRSISEQRPVVLDPGARSGRALLQLAESLNDGKLRTPWAEQRKPWWRRAFERRTRRVANRSIPPRPHLHVGEAGRTTA
jgi:Flp pilus assembly CpaE family ATPase